MVAIQKFSKNIGMNKLMAKMYLSSIKTSVKAILLFTNPKNDYEKKELNFNKKRFYKSIKELEKEIDCDCLKKNDITDMSKKLTESKPRKIRKEDFDKMVEALMGIQPPKK